MAGELRKTIANEYKRIRKRQLIKSYVGNVIKAMNMWFMPALRYSALFLNGGTPT